MNRPSTNSWTQVWRDFVRAGRQFLCGLNGHDRYLHTEGNRVTMRCVVCKHDSPGWTVGGKHYQRTQAGDRSRHRLK